MLRLKFSLKNTVKNPKKKLSVDEMDFNDTMIRYKAEQQKHVVISYNLISVSYNFSEHKNEYHLSKRLSKVIKCLCESMTNESDICSKNLKEVPRTLVTFHSGNTAKSAIH